MADNVKVLAGVGDATAAPPIATDDIGGVQYQRIKAGWGTDGVFQETADTDGVRLPVGGGQIGAINEAAPGSDIASSGLNGRLQRIAQRLSTLIGLFPTALTPAGALKDGSAEAVLTASVAAGTTTSPSGIDLSGLRNWGLIVPANFDGTQIQFLMSDTAGGTMWGVYDITNTRVVMTVGPGRYYDVPGELMALRFVKIECLTTQSTTSTDFLIIGKS